MSVITVGILLWVTLTVGKPWTPWVTPMHFPINVSNASDLIPPRAMQSPLVDLSDGTPSLEGRVEQRTSVENDGMTAALRTLLLPPPAGAADGDVKHKRHLPASDAAAAAAAAPSPRAAPPSRPGRDPDQPRPARDRLRPVPRYMWEIYYRFLASRISCHSFVSLPNLGGAITGCGSKEVLFDLGRGEEARGPLVSAHLHIELHPRAGGTTRAHTQGSHTRQGQLHENASALLEVMVTYLDNSSSSSSQEVVRAGEDAVFEVTREVRAWPEDGAFRLSVSVLPLTTSRRPSSSSNLTLDTSDDPPAASNTPMDASNDPLVTSSRPPATGNDPLAASSRPPATGNDPVATSSLPLATSSLPLAGRHHRDDHKESQMTTHCDALIWEVSLMIAREDQDACTSGGVSSPVEATEEKSFPEEWNVVPQRMRSLRSAKRNQDGRKRRGRRTRKGRNGCRLRRMYVNFQDIGWNNWIIAPKGYEAGACRGKCRFPYNALDSATNYALMVALRRRLQSKGDGACCVPSELEPLSLLYYDRANNVVLKKHPEMVVRRCGCR